MLLAPHEVTVGSLADAKPLTLFLPRTKYEQPMLVCGADDNPIAVFLGEEHRFECFEAAGVTGWKGLLIPSVSIEIDISSVFDPDAVDSINGALRRESNKLCILAMAVADHGFRRRTPVPLADGLPLASEENRAGFSKWQIALGAGLEKRVLLEVDTAPSPASR